MCIRLFQSRITHTHNAGVLAVGDEVVTYEDVSRMDPHPQWRRPITLIGESAYHIFTTSEGTCICALSTASYTLRNFYVLGASGVGKGTLIRKLINSDHTHFAAVVQRK